MGELQTGSLTSRPPDQRELEEAANAFGVETTYWDIWHREHRASVAAMTAILESLDVNAGDKASLDAAREKRERRAWQYPLAPMVRLMRDQQRPEVPVSLPYEQADAAAVLKIQLENGSSTSIPVELREIAAFDEGVIPGSRFVPKR